VFGAGVDPTNRRILEDQLAARLVQDGVAAKPSYALFPDAVPDNQQARSVVQAAGYDGVLVSRLRGVNETQQVVPGIYGGNFWTGYYGMGTWYGAYAVTSQTVNLENTLWDARGDGKLLWSSTTATRNPTSTKDFARSISRAVVPDLERSGFVPATK
jgi:hypothetical protein